MAATDVLKKYSACEEQLPENASDYQKAKNGTYRLDSKRDLARTSSKH